LWGNPKERKRLEDLGVDGKVILKIILKTWVMGVFWIDLVLDMDR
jgi:hypothetical protein